MLIAEKVLIQFRCLLLESEPLMVSINYKIRGNPITAILKH